MEVATEDSELPDSEPGDPGRVTFLRLRGRPFNFGAANMTSFNFYQMESMFLVWLVFV